MNRQKSPGDHFLGVVFDGGSHGDLRFCSKCRRYAVMTKLPAPRAHPLYIVREMLAARLELDSIVEATEETARLHKTVTKKGIFWVVRRGEGGTRASDSASWRWLVLSSRYALSENDRFEGITFECNRPVVFFGGRCRA